MSALVHLLDWLTTRNVLHLPPRFHWRLVALANRIAERAT